MLRFAPILNNDSSFRILCLGAHCDDIEVGCGGTILKLIEEYGNIQFKWIAFSSTEERAAEALTSSDRFLAGVIEKNVVIRDFRDGFLPYVGGVVKDCFEDLKSSFSPDLIFTHYRNDLHQDHRLISELTWNTFRDHLILEYEIPKFDGDLGTPNCYVHMSETLCRKKTEILLGSFPSQRGKHWFTEDTFVALMRLRGVESCSRTSYAEGFYCRKLVI
jgi:LmbE family N-acetylglucosaminyl deacetylase